MTHTTMSTSIAEQRIRTYFRAKDENRPHLMPQAFAAQAELEMVVKTNAIVFPSKAQGLEAVTDALVRQFGRTYENVYSFCLQRPSEPAHDRRFVCDWLVAMSVKDSREIRVGCGRYVWRFQPASPFLVEGLHITIESMQVLPPRSRDIVLGWVGRLPHPWCEVDDLLAHWPDEAQLRPVRDYLEREHRPRYSELG